MTLQKRIEELEQQLHDATAQLHAATATIDDNAKQLETLQTAQAAAEEANTSAAKEMAVLQQQFSDTSAALAHSATRCNELQGTVTTLEVVLLVIVMIHVRKQTPPTTHRPRWQRQDTMNHSCSKRSTRNVGR